METKFQTSFIPKRPLVGSERPKINVGVSLFMVIAVILFVVSLAGAGFTFAWEGMLNDQQAKLREDLKEREQRFSTREIEELKRKDLKIKFAKKILQNHLSVSEVFDVMAGLTIDGVRFENLDYIGPDLGTANNNSGTENSNFAKISMRGLANSFSSIAWQSDVFGRSEKYGTNKIIKNPILSDLAVDSTGNVSFSFSAEIDPADLSYEKVLLSDLEEEGLILPNSASSTTP